MFERISTFLYGCKISELATFSRNNFISISRRFIDAEDKILLGRKESTETYAHLFLRLDSSPLGGW